MTYKQAEAWLSALETGGASSNHGFTRQVQNYFLPNGVTLGEWTHCPYDFTLPTTVKWGLWVAPGEPYDGAYPLFKKSSTPKLARLELDFGMEDWFFRWDDSEASIVDMVTWLKRYVASTPEDFCKELKRLPLPDPDFECVQLWETHYA